MVPNAGKAIWNALACPGRQGRGGQGGGRAAGCTAGAQHGCSWGAAEEQQGATRGAAGGAEGARKGGTELAAGPHEEGGSMPAQCPGVAAGGTWRRGQLYASMLDMGEHVEIAGRSMPAVAGGGLCAAGGNGGGGGGKYGRRPGGKAGALHTTQEAHATPHPPRPRSQGVRMLPLPLKTQPVLRLPWPARQRWPRGGGGAAQTHPTLLAPHRLAALCAYL